MRSALALLLFTSVVFAQGVVINEIGTGVQDYLEIVNLSALPVNLGNWTLSTFYRTTAQNPLLPEALITIPPGTILPSAGILVLQEQGTANTPGSLGTCSRFTGNNWTWSSSSAVEVVLRDAQSVGQDYVFRNPYGGSASPHLPIGLTWTGTLSAILGDVIARTGNDDTHAASDWQVGLTSSPCQLNAGQWTGLRLEITTQGLGDAAFSLLSFPALSGVEVWTLYSTVDHTPDGSGPFLGIGLDALPQIFAPLLPASPFHSVLNAAGRIVLAYPAGTLPQGIFFEATSLAVVAGLPYGPSNVVAFP